MKITGINIYSNEKLSAYDASNNTNRHNIKNSALYSSRQNNSQKLNFGNLSEAPVRIMQFCGALYGFIGCFVGISLLINKLGAWIDQKTMEKYEKEIKEKEETDLQKLK